MQAARQIDTAVGGPPEAALPDEARVGLADKLRERTRALHARAERSGIIQDIVRGRATLFGYGLYLRNLFPAYMQLERGLRRCRQTPGVGGLARREVFRAASLVADLEALFGLSWNRQLPLLPAGERYAQQIAAVDQGEAYGLIGHAYTRYLGDLSGGQILKRLLAQSMSLGPKALNFYEFPMAADLKAFKLDYRRAIDLAGLVPVDLDPVFDAAEASFCLNIEVSEAVQRVATVDSDVARVRVGAAS